MQFRPEMIEAIKAERKTQTRRPVKFGDFHRGPLAGCLTVWDGTERLRWRAQGRYSVCPGRGKPRVGLIQLTGIRKEAVAEISEGDALAEGFESREAFLAAWKNLYPKSDLQENVWVLEFKAL